MYLFSYCPPHTFLPEGATILIFLHAFLKEQKEYDCGKKLGGNSPKHNFWGHSWHIRAEKISMKVRA